MIGSHAQGLHEKLDRLVDAVLVIQADASHVERVCVGGVHPQDVTEREHEGVHINPNTCFKGHENGRGLGVAIRGGVLTAHKEAVLHLS